MHAVQGISKSSATWWWVFGLLIAVPALILSFQGLRAVRAERIEREQQIRRQQQQVAQLMDGAVVTLLSGLENELRRSEDDSSIGRSELDSAWADIPIFSISRQGLTVFPRDRLYFGGFGSYPTSVSAQKDWPSAIQQLVDQAQAAEAQGRSVEAITHYRQIARTEPALSDWAEMGIARLQDGSSVDAAFGRGPGDSVNYAQGLTPTGLPVALLVAAELERASKAERFPFLPVLHQLLRDLRSGTWWLSREERHFYDATLCRIIHDLDAGVADSVDAKLDELDAIDQVIRQSPPYLRDQVTRAFVTNDTGSYLVLWSPSTTDPDAWFGTAVSQKNLQGYLDATLIPLLSDQPFLAEIRDARDSTIWGQLPEDNPVIQTVGSHAVREWEYAFSGPTGSSGRRPRLLWYGFIALLIVMLTTGVAMTIRVAHQEMELGRLQNDFVAAVSHEFKSPITGVRLLVERLASGRTKSSEQSEAYYKAIDDELTRLERLVNRLLVIQQVQADRRPFHFTTVSLVELARQAVDLQIPQANAKSIRLRLEADEGIPHIQLDEAAVLDMLENLLDNAVKYSPPETSVVMSIHRKENFIVVDVRDEGIGIAPNEQKRIFDKFYRAKDANEYDVRGTGLGLALVKNVVETHKGTISLTSTPGQGSCFSLQFPIHQAEN